MHISQPNLHCTYKGCTSVYKNRSSLRSHISRKHRALVPHDPCCDNIQNIKINNRDNNVESINNLHLELGVNNEDVNSIRKFNDNGNDTPDNHDDDDDDGLERNTLKHALAKYLLYLRGCTRATNKDVIGILSSAQELIVTYVEYYLNHVKTIL